MKLKVEIWSDIMCPFCYIGKRKFEQALAHFAHQDKVAIVWHSFQLDPTIQYHPDQDLYDYLAERKGQTRQWSLQVHKQVAQTAREVGLTYNFDKAVLANSFDAHRLIQLAKRYDLGGAAEERLFKAYFTEGKNVSDHPTLVQLGAEIGLDSREIREMLQSNAYADVVRKDVADAEALGIRGVPFFVINGKYGVSGAQPSEVFLQALQQVWPEYEEQNLSLVDLSSPEGSACTPDGPCEP